MLQRAFYLLHGSSISTPVPPDRSGRSIELRRRGRPAGPAGELLDGLFGPHAAALQAAGPVQLFRAARAVSSGWPGGPIPGWRPAPSSSPRWPARRWAASSPRTKCCSTPRRWQREVRVQRRRLFPQGRPLPAAGRGLAGGAHAGHRAVRRLRQTRPHLRPSPRHRRPPRLAGNSTNCCNVRSIARKAEPGRVRLPLTQRRRFQGTMSGVVCLISCGRGGVSIEGRTERIGNIGKVGFKCRTRTIRCCTEAICAFPPAVTWQPSWISSLPS